MSTSTKTKSFIRQFAAVIKGDSAQVQAEKTFRQVDSAFQRQIASLKGDTIKFEDDVTTAQEALDSAKINHGKPLSADSRDVFINNLLKAKNNLTDAEEALTAHKAKITFLEETHASLSEEVDA